VLPQPADFVPDWLAATLLEGDAFVAGLGIEQGGSSRDERAPGPFGLLQPATQPMKRGTTKYQAFDALRACRNRSAEARVAESLGGLFTVQGLPERFRSQVDAMNAAKGFVAKNAALSEIVEHLPKCVEHLLELREWGSGRLETKRKRIRDTKASQVGKEYLDLLWQGGDESFGAKLQKERGEVSGPRFE
jgi:hypothetical protein